MSSERSKGPGTKKVSKEVKEMEISELEDAELEDIGYTFLNILLSTYIRSPRNQGVNFSQVLTSIQTHKFLKSH
jgi:hypothetical protein